MDAAGNTLATASSIGVLDSRERVFNDWVSSRLDTVDLYRFNLGGASTINLRLTGLAVNADVQLLDDRGAVLIQSVTAGPADEQIIRSFGAGEYYVRVVPVAGAETNYRLSLSAQTISVDGAGNTLEAANGIGVLDSRERVFNDWVSSRLDSVDLYRFYLGSASTVNLRLSGLAGNAGIQILNDRGVLLTQSAAPGLNDEQISRSFAAGEYYVRVLPGAGAETNYRLSMSASPLVFTFNEQAGTSGLDSLTGSQGTVSFGGRGNDRLSGSSGQGNTILVGGSGDDTYDVPNASVVTVYDWGGGTDTISARGITPNSATAFAFLVDGRHLYAGDARTGQSFVILDWQGEGQIEFFELADGRHAIAEANSLFRGGIRSLTWEGSGLLNGFDPLLRNARAVDEAIVRYSTRAGQIEAGLGGTIDGAGNTLFAAADLGNLLAPRSANPLVRNDRVSPNDVNDYYRFTLDSTAQVTITLGNLAADADLYLLASDGNQVDATSASLRAGVAQDDVSRVLRAGSYYVLVQDYGGDTPYTLTLATPLAGVIDGAGNSTAAARNLGNLLDPLVRSPLIFNDRVSAADDADYYRFTLSARALVDLRLDGLSSDADLLLLGSDGNLVDSGSSSRNSDTSPEGLSYFLNAGTYYALVEQYDGDTPYRLTVGAQASRAGDGAGNTLAAAADLGNLLAPRAANPLVRNDRVNLDDDVDYYRFTLDGNAQVAITLGNLAADADLYLLASDGSQVDETSMSERSGVAQDDLARVLRAGTYYVRVQEWGGDTPYTLILTAQSASAGDGAGNSTAAARNLGDLLDPLARNPLVFNDRVSAADDTDFYRFTLSDRARVDIALTGLSADADLFLLRADGTALDAQSQSIRGGASDDDLSRLLQAGTYYVKVDRYTDETDYRLTIATSGATAGDGAGNSAAQARDLQSLYAQTLQTQPLVFRDRVNDADPEDWYRFTTDALGQVDIGLTGLLADADLYLLRSDGQLVDEGSYSINDATAAERIVRRIDPGTYYIQVVQSQGDTPYALSITGTAATAGDGAGNTPGQARDLGNLLAPRVTNPRILNDRVSALDDRDYYKFSLDAAARVTLTLDGLASDADLYLYASDGSLLDPDASSLLSGTQPDRVTRQLNAGTYYALVQQFQGDTPYSLSIASQATSVGDGAGNTLATARQVDLLEQLPQEFNDRVSSTDSDDYYRFRVTQRSEFGALLTGLTADADLVLLDLDGRVVDTSQSPGTTEDVMLDSLEVGTYYVRVSQFEGDSDYRLVLAALPESTSRELSALADAPPDPGNAMRMQVSSDDLFRAAAPLTPGHPMLCGCALCGAVRAGSPLRPFVGGLGADRYFTAEGALLAVDDRGGSDGDLIDAGGISLERSTSKFAEIGGRDLLAWDTASRQAMVLFEWRSEANRIETFRMAGQETSYGAFSAALADHGYERVASFDALASASEVPLWQELQNRYAGVAATLAPGGG